MMRGLGFRSGIKEDFALLELIPDDEVERKAALRQSISARIDDLIEFTAQWRRLRAAALTHGGNWRDIILFLNTVLFTAVWWNVDHDRQIWFPLFVILILATAVTAVFAVRGIGSLLRRKQRRVS